jgi:hypothetical protein
MNGTAVRPVPHTYVSAFSAFFARKTMISHSANSTDGVPSAAAPVPQEAGNNTPSVDTGSDSKPKSEIPLAHLRDLGQGLKRFFATFAGPSDDVVRIIRATEALPVELRAKIYSFLPNKTLNFHLKQIFKQIEDGTIDAPHLKLKLQIVELINRLNRWTPKKPAELVAHIGEICEGLMVHLSAKDKHSQISDLESFIESLQGYYRKDSGLLRTYAQVGRPVNVTGIKNSLAKLAALVECLEQNGFLKPAQQLGALQSSTADELRKIEALAVLHRIRESMQNHFL